VQGAALMGTRAALACGTVLSLAAVSLWSWTADLTIGSPAPLHLGRDLPADYLRLAAAPTGNGVALFAVSALIYAACFAVSGLRRVRREAAQAREGDQAYRDAEAAERSAGWR
jgi:hypothetical protein